MKPCPNDPPCPHQDALHDINTPDDPQPMCCVPGCGCGKYADYPQRAGWNYDTDEDGAPRG